MRGARRRARFVGVTGFALADPLLALGQGDAVVVFQPGRQLAELHVVVEWARAVGARVVFVTDELGEVFEVRVDAVLTAPHSDRQHQRGPDRPRRRRRPGPRPDHPLDETRGVEHSHQLTALREQLLAQKEPRTRRT